MFIRYLRFGTIFFCDYQCTLTNIRSTSSIWRSPSPRQKAQFDQYLWPNKERVCLCGETHSFHNHLYGHYKLRLSATYISSWINYPLAYALSINHAVTHTSHTYNRQTDMHIHINSDPALWNADDDSRKINCVSGHFRFQVWASIYRASRRVRWPNGPDCDRATRYSRWTELRLRPSVMTRR